MIKEEHVRNGSKSSTIGLFAACLLTVFLLVGGNASAQATLGTLEGVTTDDQGVGLPGVTLTMTNKETGYSYSAVSRSDGRYVIAGIQPGIYDIEVILAGFETQKRMGMTFNVGGILKIDFALKASTLAEEVTVTAESPMVEVTKSEVSKVIDRSKIENLPLLNRSLSGLAMMKAGVVGDQSNAQPSGSEEVTVDGVSNERVARNDQKTTIPADAIQEFRVLTNQYQAEFGNSSGMIWTVQTRSGTNDLRGRLSYFMKDETFDDVNYFVNHDGYKGTKLSKDQYDNPPYKYNLFGAVLGGPIKKDKAHFFLAFETLRQQSYEQIVSPLVAQEEINVDTKPTQVMAKFNYQLNKKHLFSLRYNLDKQKMLNQGIGGLATKERGYDYIDTKHEVQGSWMFYPSGNSMNEFRMMYSTQDGLDVVHYPGTYSIDRPSGLFGKNASFPQGGGEFRWQFVDNFSLFLNKHSLKFGLDFSTIHEDIFAYLYDPGYFIFTTDAPFDASDFGTYPLMFIYNIGKPDVAIGYKEAAVFAQDTWRISSRLTFNVGLRWNYYDCDFMEINHADLHNLNPRFGFSYDPVGDGKTSIRGGVGTFTQNPQLNIGLFGALYAQVQIRTMIYPNYPDPFQLNPFFPTIPGEIPLDTYRTAENLAPPTTTQVTLGAEREFLKDLSVGLDFVYAKGSHFTRLENYNPIIPGTRFVHVDPTKGNDMVFADRGRSQYKAMYLMVTKRHSNGWSLDVAYTLSQSKADVESEQTDAWSYDADAWERQFGLTNNNATHRLTASAIVDLPWGFQLAGLFNFNSATPWNAAYASDVNQDSLSGDYVDQFRNSRRGFAYNNLNLRLSKYISIGRFRFQVLAEAYNVFNKANFGGIYPYFGTELFGTPLAAYDPRKIQLGARIDF